MKRCIKPLNSSGRLSFGWNSCRMWRFIPQWHYIMKVGHFTRSRQQTLLHLQHDMWPLFNLASPWSHDVTGCLNTNCGWTSRVNGHQFVISQVNHSAQLQHIMLKWQSQFVQKFMEGQVKLQLDSEAATKVSTGSQIPLCEHVVITYFLAMKDQDWCPPPNKQTNKQTMLHLKYVSNNLRLLPE